MFTTNGTKITIDAQDEYPQEWTVIHPFKFGQSRRGSGELCMQNVILNTSVLMEAVNVDLTFFPANV